MWHFMALLTSALRQRNKPPTHQLFDLVHIDCRVGLTDIDINFHMTNARYLRYLDIARMTHWVTTGMLWRFMKARLSAVITNTEISHIRELRTWQRFSIDTRFVGWDEKYVYYELRLISDGKLCAHAFQRMACLHRGKSMAMTDVLKRINLAETGPELPEAALIWKKMLETKKRATAFNDPQTTPADK